MGCFAAASDDMMMNLDGLHHLTVSVDTKKGQKNSTNEYLYRFE